MSPWQLGLSRAFSSPASFLTKLDQVTQPIRKFNQNFRCEVGLSVSRESLPYDEQFSLGSNR